MTQCRYCHRVHKRMRRDTIRTVDLLFRRVDDEIEEAVRHFRAALQDLEGEGRTVSVTIRLEML